LRPAEAADAGFARDVYVEARREEMAPAGWPEPVLLAFLHDQFRLQTLHYDQHYADAARLIVEVEGVPAGRLILLDAGGEVRVVDIALLPAFRRLGIGGALMDWVLVLARDLGRPIVSLHVEPNNPALRLYSDRGFQPVAQRGVYLLMERRTDP
jgi:ribosomal protein S18 acetylase RimI-like enzyme